MVSFKFIAAAALASLPLSFANVARITSFEAPATASPGQNITATFNTEIFIQNWSDFGIIWGLLPASRALSCTNCLGVQIGYTNLFGPGSVSESSSAHNFTAGVQIPPSQPAGDYVLSLAMPFLVGASGETGFTYLNSSITISS